MVEVYFVGRGVWVDESLRNCEGTCFETREDSNFVDTNEPNELMHVSYAYDVFGDRCVFRLTEWDEKIYNDYSKSLGDIELLLPSLTHPDCEYTSTGLPAERAPACRFHIDTSRKYRIWVVKVGENHKKTINDKNATWNENAREIALTFYREKSGLSVEQLAKKTHTEMVKRKGYGKPGMTGRGGKVPSAETIKRHALNGIKS